MKISRAKTLAACALAVALSAPHAARADAHQAQDLISGNGTAGPYSLSWTHFLSGSEAVSLDGATLHWGADYILDTDAGTITFTHPLALSENASVRYAYDTTTAKAQGNGLTVPLSLALDQHLALNGEFDRPAGTSVSSPGALNFGLKGGWQNSHGGALTTQLLFVPALTGQDAQASPNGMARLGLAIGGQTGLGRTTLLNFGLSRGGSGLGAAGGSEWTAGRQNLTVGGTFTPSRQMQATLGYAQSDPTDQTDTSARTQTLNANATLRPTAGSELDAAFTNTASPTVGDTAQNLDIKAAVTINPKISLNAESHQAETGTGGVTQTLNASALIKPSGQSQLGATFASTDAPGQANDNQTLNLQAALTPNKAVQVSTNVALCQNAAGNTQTTSINGVAQPNRFVKVSGGYTWRNAVASQPAGLTSYDSSTAQVTLAPLTAVQFVGTYDQNPCDGSGNLQRQADHGLSLQTNVGALSLTGGYVWSDQYADTSTSTNLHVGVGLKVSANTQFTGDYKHCLTESAAAGGTDAYTVGLTRNLGDAFDLTLNGTLQQQMGAVTASPNTVSASASLGMKF